MHQIVCDKCQRIEPVVWTQMFVGWTKDERHLNIRAGYFVAMDKRHGEYLEQLGHGNLPVPEGWQYIYSQDLDDGDERQPYTHLCPACRTPDVQDD